MALVVGLTTAGSAYAAPFGLGLGKNKDKKDIMLPLSIEPFIISLEMTTEEIKKSSENIRAFLQNCITLTLAQIASEII